MAVATLLSSGPWLVVLLLSSGYYLRGESWIGWAVIGFASAVLLLGLTLLVLRRARLGQCAAPTSGMIDKPALPHWLDSRRGAFVFSFAFSSIVGLVLAPLIFDGIDLPVAIWILFGSLWLVMAYVICLIIGTITHPEPWIERRSEQRPE
jgi:hypothetical protein